MTVIGVDLGLRSAYFATIDSDGELELSSVIYKPKKAPRHIELQGIGHEAGALFNAYWQPMVVIESPIVAGVRNLQTTIGIAQTHGVVLSSCRSTTPEQVAVAQWKKATVGRGNANKDDVSRWLQQRYPIYHEQCAGDQNWIDATCIALYGVSHA